MNNMKRALVFIDGNAFKHYLSKCCKNKLDHYFQYKDFCNDLVTDDEELIRIYYYCALPAEFFPKMNAEEKIKTQQIFASKKNFIKSLQESGNIDVELGHTRFKERNLENKPIFEEKGVDVKMASDITKYTFIGNYDVFYVLTADNDIAYCMKTARDFGKTVTWVDISTNQSAVRAILSREADEKIDLDPKRVTKFTSTPKKK